MLRTIGAGRICRALFVSMGPFGVPVTWKEIGELMYTLCDGGVMSSGRMLALAQAGTGARVTCWNGTRLLLRFEENIVIMTAIRIFRLMKICLSELVD